jgi:NhaP-type Na+/H+ or K+/H+ antiporter
MQHHIAELIASVLIVGIALQWIGWRLKIPALILLIAAGFVMGPLSGWLKPSEDFGDLLQPLVSLSVAVILFEGGLNLRWHELKQNTHVIYRLVTWNVLLTFALGSLTAHYLVGLSWPVALIFGAIIIVTGPTVIMPLLKQANLKQQPASLLRWEGIVNDPIGALLVVLIYGYYVLSEGDALFMNIVGGMLVSLTASLLVGVGMGLFLARVFRQGQVPEYLKSPIILIAVLLVYSVCNRVQSEAGLLATTVLGITLANQQLNTLHELKRFKEYVTILLVSSTFIILTADIDPEILMRIGWQGWLLLVVVIFVIRPLAIYLSTIGTDISKQNRMLIAWIAPRGIVAASIAGLFGAELVKKGYDGAELLLPLVFALIILTVSLHGLSIGWVARKLGLASVHPDGVMLVGASPWSTALAAELDKNNIPVVLIDTNWQQLKPARMQNIPTYYGEILSERTEEVLELSHITQLLAMTPNEAYNTLICSRFSPELGHHNTYELAWQSVAEGKKGKTNKETKLPDNAIRGDVLFGEDKYYSDLVRAYDNGWQFNTTHLSERYRMSHFLETAPAEKVLIAAIDKVGHIYFYPWSKDLNEEDFNTIISFMPSESAKPNGN